MSVDTEIIESIRTVPILFGGGGAISPGVGGSLTWSYQDPTPGWNIGFQLNSGIAYQYGKDVKTAKEFWEFGLGWPVGTGGTAFYVRDPWKWPWRQNWWPWKDKNECKKEK